MAVVLFCPFDLKNFQVDFALDGIPVAMLVGGIPVDRVLVEGALVDGFSDAGVERAVPAYPDDSTASDECVTPI